MVNALDWMLTLGDWWSPVVVLAVFGLSSALMLWRLECMTGRGVEGTVLGTLVMPYCSGMGNLIFAGLLVAQGGPGGEVVINSLVNNVTNLTLLLGLPALIWGLQVTLKKGKVKERRRRRIHRLSLLLTVLAGIFFTGALWALGSDGVLTRGDAIVLVGLFFFWQVFEVFEVLKANVRENRRTSGWVFLDFGLLLAGAYGLYCSIEWIVGWIEAGGAGWLSMENLGWFTGLLMVLPNAGLAFYYAMRQRPDIVASSQLGDGHICIPLCIGLFGLFHPIEVPGMFGMSLLVLGVAYGIHSLSLLLFGGIPRWVGAVLVGGYGYFLWSGLV
mgnify:CR=1 FL=1